MSLKQLKQDLHTLKNPEKAKVLQRFFKTGKGEYGEGDVFLGVTVPQIRKLIRKFTNLALNELENLIQSKIHEERLLALLLLVQKMQKSKDEKEKKKLYQYYVRYMPFINNWDLVDLSASYIVGVYLLNKDTSVLKKWAKSKNFWYRRIAILSTHYFIRQNQFEETLKITEYLLMDKEDLIHKAAGWMLREIGKRDIETEENFLKIHYKIMPRTMLRYAIERFPEKRRLAYLNGEI